MGYVLTPELVRAARGLLGWSQHDLASRAGINVKTINRLEAAAVPVSSSVSAKLQAVFSAADVQFIATNTDDGTVDGLGVRKRPLHSHLGIKVL
nr:helix-turn-helix transcriptional regulator [Rhizobium soli]